MERHYWFWKDLPQWFVGLAPMDGVTDLIYREIFALMGASPIVTEFTSAEWLAHNALKLLRDFSYTQRQKPVVAQIFGVDPESFYAATLIACEMWFDGIDINMWCPSKNVASRGAGAGLIQNPDLAHNLIDACIAARDDYATGARSVTDLPLKNKMKDLLARYNEILGVSQGEKSYKPISVKTRLGYNEITIEQWAHHLVQKPIATLTLHGRTFRQMYSGQADWEHIAIGARIAQEAGVIPVGNGDIQNKTDAHNHCQTYGTRGVLIGRASYGNPWLFTDREPTLEDRLTLAVWHSRQWERLRGTHFFFAMRKHLGWYLRGVDHASEFRSQLMLTNSSAEVEALFFTWFGFRYDEAQLPFDHNNDTATQWASAFGHDENDENDILNVSL